MSARNCGYCGISLAYEGGIGAYGKVFCTERCADEYERDLEHEDSVAMEYEAALDRVNDDYGIY